MRIQRNLFWGLVCITLGVLFLARNWDLFPMPDWYYIRSLWPVLFILGGIALLLRTSVPAVSTVATVMLAVALPFWLFSAAGIHRGYRTGRNLSMRFDVPDPPDAPEVPDVPEPPDAPEPPDPVDSDDDDDNRSLHSGTFTEEMPSPAPAEARFVLEGGASTFRINEPTSRLIDAHARAFNLYTMSIDRNAGQIPTVRLTPAKGSKTNINLFDDDDNDQDFGEVAIKLNEAPAWDMEMDFGAGAGDFDLSRYIVKKLDIEAGAASLDLKLGDKAPQSDVKISSGMASVKIRVPRTVGVKLVTDGGLNSTEVDGGFDKVGNNTYLSSNYQTAAKKMTIRYDGGLSSLDVARY